MKTVRGVRGILWSAVSLLGSGVLAVAALPSSYDLNSDELLTPVKNQGDLGTCWAFSTTTAFQSSLLKQNLVTLSSPELQISPWHLATANGNQTNLVPEWDSEFQRWNYDGGWGGFNEYAVGYWTRGRGSWQLDPNAAPTPAGGGPVLISNNPLNVYPSDATAQGKNLRPYVAPASQTQTSFLLSQSISLDWNKGSESLAAYQERLKQALLKYGGISVYVNADNDQTDRSNPVWYQPADTVKRFDHAVTLVGWDDSKELTYGNLTFVGGWLIQNSWGTNTGDVDPVTGQRGYYWVPFADASMANVKYGTAFVVQWAEHTPTGTAYAPTVVQNQIFAPYPLSLGGSNIGNGIGVLTQAVGKQDAPPNSFIGAIGLWQADPETTVKIQIYTQWNNGPSGDTLWTTPHEFTLNPDGSGYNLIELDDPIALTDGSPVYVLVDFGTAYAAPVVVDTRTYEMLPLDSGSYLGLSWFLNEDGQWEDLAAVDGDDDPVGIYFMKLLRLQTDLNNHDANYPINPNYGFNVDGDVQTAGGPNTILELEFEDGGVLTLNDTLTVTNGVFDVMDDYATGIVNGPASLSLPGKFVKIGDGALVLNARLTAAGSAQVNEGSLYLLNRFATAGSFSINGESTYVSVASGALLSVGLATYVNGGWMDVGGTLRTNWLNVSGGQFRVLPGGLLLVNNLDLTGGLVELAGNQNFPGTVSVGSGAELDLLPGSTIGMGQFNVPGGYTYLYPGSTLNVSGPITLSNEGVLEVDGNFFGPSIWVGPTAWLMGSGFLTANVTNDGFIAPGNSPGTLTINGNFTQTTNGTFLLEIASPEVYDRLIVNGAASLAGTLAVEPYDGYVFTFGESFEGFLQSEAITGSFDSIEMPEGFRGRLVEDSGDLTLVVAPVSYTQVAVTPNQWNVAQALDAFIPATGGDRLVVSTALDFLTAAEYPAAFNAISPAFYESLASMNLELIFNQGQQMQQRFRSVQLGAQAGLAVYGLRAPVLSEKPANGKETKNVLIPAPDNKWGVWVQGNGIFSNQASVNNVPSYRSSSGGFLGGADYRLGDALSAGLYAGYQGAFADYDGNGRTVLNGVRFGGYASYGKATGFFANTMVGGGYTSYTVTRPISFGNLSRTAKSAPGGGDFESLLNLGYNWQLGNFNFGPVATAQYTYLGIAPFTENGADSLDLKIGQQNANSLRTLFGGQVAYLWQISPKWAIIPQGSLYWQHEFLQNPRTIDASLDGGSGPAFAYRTAAPSRDSIYAGAGVTVQLGERWNTNFYYNANFGRQDFVSHQITGGIGFSW